MFAVKGWSVDASALKAQTEPFKAGKSTQDGEQKLSRKRKREQNAQRNEDVGKMWDQHIEGKSPVKPKKDKKSKKGKNSKKGEDAQKPNKKTKHSNGPETGANAQAVSRKREKRDEQEGETTTEKAVQTVPAAQHPALPSASAAKLTPMQEAMRQKLVSARFRHLNQTLYTAPSDTALQLFDQNPELFEDYHAGFRQQVTTWPENPVDTFIASIRTRGAIRPPKFHHKDSRKPKPQADTLSASPVAPLPRTQGTCIIADLGCGDARLSSTLSTTSDTTKLNLKIHSYDLHSPSPLVTKADISNLPQPDGSVDIAIFCLALMGTNWISFIDEAYRILHWKGELWVAEIKSRFGRVGKKGRVVEHSVGSKKKQVALAKVKAKKDKELEEVDEESALRTEVDGVESQKQETDVSGFVDVLRRRGFVLKEGQQGLDLGNKMFVKMEFVKAAAPTKGKNVPKEEDRPKFAKKKFIDEHADDVGTDDEAKVLKPCLYKIR